MLSANDQLSSAALSRLAEGIRLHNKIPDSRLVFSGYSGKGKDSKSQAEMLYETDLLLGVSAENTLQIREPANTFMEARYYYETNGSKCKHIIVTDAVHMPRAMKLFKMNSLNPIPAPTNHRYKSFNQKKQFSWIPSTEYIENLSLTVHEYVGILWANIRYKN